MGTVVNSGIAWVPPETPGDARIPLTQGYETVIDAEDAEYLQTRKWFAVRSRQFVYAVCKIDYKHIYMHKFLLETESLVDHVNGNTLDNRRNNLRMATHRQNAMNRKKQSGSVHSQFKGVTRHRGNWIAAIQPGRYIHLGTFDTEIGAARAYDAAARIFYGEFAKTNF